MYIEIISFISNLHAHKYCKMKKLYSIIIITICAYATIFSQSIDTEHSSYLEAKTSLEALKELLAIPNDANHVDDIDENVVWCELNLHNQGFVTERLETESVPLLLASQSTIDESLPTLLYYFHIDGQPVDPSFWFQDNPYEAVLKEEREAQGWVDIPWDTLQSKSINPDWRIFARSSSDDKSPFVMFLTALTTLKKNQQSAGYNIKVILDFEEEKGSPNLASAVAKNKDKLSCDALLIFDGPKHLSNIPTIAYGARGITSLTIKVFGPTFPLHSGHYGNYTPNPALRLSQLISSMKDEHGRVVIKGYYDGISLDEKTRKILAMVPDDEAVLRAKLGVGSIDSVGSNYQESLQYPSLNIRGMSSAWIGKEVRTIVPATATAEIDLRLVVESDGERLKDLVKNHIKTQGYLILDRKPSSVERVLNAKICQINERGVTKAFRTDLDSKLGIWVYEQIKETFKLEPIRVRTMGGTLPTSPFINTLEVPAVIIPLVNSDNNQHSPNENLRLGNYFDGVKCIQGLLTASY